jgi:hypothetical protein
MGRKRFFVVAATQITGKSELSDRLMHSVTAKGVHVALPLRQGKVAHVLFTTRNGFALRTCIVADTFK